MPKKNKSDYFGLKNVKRKKRKLFEEGQAIEDFHARDLGGGLYELGKGTFTADELLRARKRHSQEGID